MRLRIIRAYIYKELVELVRSRFIVMVFLLPTMLLLLFGYGIRMEVTGARTLIIDNDNSTLSQRLIAKFEHSRYFRTQVEPISEVQALGRIKQAKADVIVVIPE
ncbi:MAG: ABC transporter permease, partial [Campylobacterota bacterium]